MLTPGCRTLEELQEVFDAKWPPKAALQKSTGVRRSEAQLDELAA